MDTQRRLKVAVFFNARREQGGLYQYALTLTRCLHDHGTLDYFLVHATGEPLPLEITSGRWRLIEPSRSRLLVRRLGEGALLQAARLRWPWPLPVVPELAELQALRPDVVLYLKPTVHSFLWPYRSVFPVHDLQHRLQSQFPEVSSRGEYWRREFLYRHALDRAAAVLVDSEIGKEDVVRAYRTDASKIHPLPYLAPTWLAGPVEPADLERARRTYPVEEPFLFYPAAFWQHKNHAALLRALALLKDRHGKAPRLLLAGSKSHEFSRLVALARELGLGSQVRFLGYLPDNDVAAIYRLARALVMPTSFGPTNLPVLEAWSLGCPVVTSDIRGLREQVGDAGLLVPPTDFAALADAIWRVWTDDALANTLRERGRERVARWTPQALTSRLEAILAQAAVGSQTVC